MTYSDKALAELLEIQLGLDCVLQIDTNQDLIVVRNSNNLVFFDKKWYQFYQKSSESAKIIDKYDLYLDMIEKFILYHKHSKFIGYDNESRRKILDFILEHKFKQSKRAYL